MQKARDAEDHAIMAYGGGSWDLGCLEKVVELLQEGEGEDESEFDKDFDEEELVWEKRLTRTRRMM
ncbi:MAG: hypothetical protein M1835_003066 [Candelina submexicana]|nr:MAG: hypothetical protein M1835_003066 [Candelina submexicana]